MAQSIAVARPVPAHERPAALDPSLLTSVLPPSTRRRKLQLALAVIWLLDGMLQFQPSMRDPRDLRGAGTPDRR